MGCGKSAPAKRTENYKEKKRRGTKTALLVEPPAEPVPDSPITRIGQSKGGAYTVSQLFPPKTVLKTVETLKSQSQSHFTSILKGRQLLERGPPNTDKSPNPIYFASHFTQHFSMNVADKEKESCSFKARQPVRMQPLKASILAVIRERLKPRKLNSYQLRYLAGFSTRIGSMALSFNDKFVAVCSAKLIPKATNNSSSTCIPGKYISRLVKDILLVDVRTGTTVGRFVAHGTDAIPRMMFFTIDNQVLYACYSEGRIMTWNVGSRKPGKELVTGDEFASFEIINCGHVSANGKHIVIGCDDYDTGEVCGCVSLFRSSDSKHLLNMLDHKVSVTAVATNDEGSIIASADVSGEIIIWNASDGSWVGSMQSYRTPVYTLLFLSDDRLLSQDDRHIFVWCTHQFSLLYTRSISGVHDKCPKPISVDETLPPPVIVPGGTKRPRLYRSTIIIPGNLILAFGTLNEVCIFNFFLIFSSLIMGCLMCILTSLRTWEQIKCDHHSHYQLVSDDLRVGTPSLP